ncbi:MAG: Rid family detoxifying hydrolase [Candidatus Micrarchaeota archaeon]|nr:Rid family detoxifying hydrolase [Candidatus Micrarchaeota archaeon]MDE1823747.1 Rid family detoxifying hydrolase [Candidatus Micrarchaeota archaeon]MDE1849544.1 Rid family detoxifying hydrolase [Candidatus Micrarchaeota archaeon]
MKTRVGDRSLFPLSQGILSKDFLFVSGQIHMREGKLLEGTIEQQTHQVMENAKGILHAARLGFNDVVKVTIYVTDMSLYEKVNDVYRNYFSEPFPAREMVCVKELPAGARIEISMIAAKHKA